MKKTILWLLPLFALATAFLLLNPKKEAELTPSKGPAEKRTNEAQSETLKKGEIAPTTSPTSQEPAVDVPETAAARSALAEISGRQIQGRLHWKNGALPQGLEVRARTRATIEGKKEFLGVVSEDGSFRIPVPEKFLVGKVSAESDFHSSESVEVRAKDDKSLPEIALTLKIGGCLRGVVYEPDGRPASGAKVLLARTLEPSMWGGNQDRESLKPQETTTDEQGRFAFRGQPEGKDRLVRASLAGFGPCLEDGVVIQTMRTTDVVLTLTPECVVEGLILDTEDKPVEGAKVVAAAPRDMSAMMQLALLQGAIQEESSTQSASDGSFRIGQLAAGSYRVQASKTGLESASTDPITLAAGEKNSSLQIRLGKGKAITGRVVNDKNEPVMGAKIKLQPDWMSGEFGIDAQWNAQSLMQETSADEKGQFRLDGLGKGAFTVEATHETFGAAKRDRVRPGAPGFELRLQPQGMVRGKVTAVGIGAPISKFTIVATKKEAFVDRPVETESFHEKTGQYELKNLPPGSLKLRVTAEGFAAESRTIEVSSGNTLEGVDFSLTPAATARGRVLAIGSGVPIANAQVSIAPSGSNPMGFVQDMMDQNRAVAQSDDEGNFELSGLPGGANKLRATHADFATGNSEEFELSPGGTTEGIVISLSGGGGIDGFVYDDEGAPVRGANIIAFGIQSGTFKNGQTDESGYFVFEKGLAPGQYQLTSMKNAPQNSEDGEVSAEFMQGMKTGFAQVEDGKIARIVLGEKKEGLCTVSGRVMAGGKPVAGAVLSLIPKADASSGKTTHSALEIAVAGKEGEFTLKNVAPGKQSISVSGQRGGIGAASTIFEIEVPKTSEHRVDFSLPGGRIAGIVTDYRTGKAIAGVFVMVSPKQDGTNLDWTGAGFGQAQTDEEGRFQIENMKAGVYRVSAGQTAFFPGSGGQGLGRVSRTIELAESGTLENVDFSLRPAATIQGSVFVAGGKPLAGASIHFLDASGENLNPISLVNTDETGQFRDETLSAGSYTVTAQAPGYVSGSQKVSVEEGGKASVQIHLSPGTQVSVKLLDNAGTNIDGATFQIFDEKGAQVTSFLGVQEMMAAWTSGQKTGVYALGNMTPGIYRVLVKKEGKTLLDTTVKIEAISSQTIELKVSL